MNFENYETMFNLKASNANQEQIKKDVKTKKVLLLKDAEADDINNGADSEPMEVGIKQEIYTTHSAKNKVWSRASKQEGKYACDTVHCDYRSKKLWNLKAHCKRKSHDSSHILSPRPG